MRNFHNHYRDCSQNVACYLLSKGQIMQHFSKMIENHVHIDYQLTETNGLYSDVTLKY
jgi:hypothetical protein